MISRDSARRKILENQGLLAPVSNPSKGGRYSDQQDAMRAVVAVQTQYPASLGPALAARAEFVTAQWLHKAISKDRRLLKGWNLRSTLHTSLAEDHLLMLTALSTTLKAGFVRWMANYNLDTVRLDELHGQIYEALAGGPLGRKELHERVPFYKGLPMVGWGLDAKGLALEGQVILSAQGASRTEFARLDQWLPDIKACELTEAEALKQLMLRYFAGYGPATFADFLYWSGSKASRAAAAFAEIKQNLACGEVEGKTGLHYWTGSLETARGRRSPLRLLPKFDPLIMGHKDKSLFIPEKLLSMVSRKAGQVEATVLVDGQVRGTWRTSRRGSTLHFMVEPYEKMKKSWLSPLQREAMRVAKSLGMGDVSISGF